MPTHEAQFGEVWSTTDVASGRTMLGIVAEVTPTRVTFVSLMGHRSAVPQSRLLTNWRYVQPAPRRILPSCSRWGCVEQGMIQFNRVGVVEYVCPRHVPFGAQCQVTTNYTPRPESQTQEPRACACPVCGLRDPAEDVRITALPARLWLCAPPGCSARWVTIPRTVAEANVPAFAESVRRQLARWHFEADVLLVNDRALLDSITPHMPNGLSAMWDPMTELAREHLWAVLRVRGSITRERPATPIQRLGGSPSRSGVVGSADNPTPSLARTPTTTYQPPQSQAARDRASAASALRQLGEHEATEWRNLFEAPISTVEVPPVTIDVESLWVQRISGVVMIVREVGRSTDGIEVVTFRKSTSEDGEGDAYVTMTRRDFLIQHRLYGHDTSDAATTTTPMVAIAPNEEWECLDGSGSSLTVERVDYRRETVHGTDLKTQKARQIPFAQFQTGRWRKIVRKSAWARLRNPEIGKD